MQGHFPTKDDLVNELAMALSESNSRMMKEDENITMLTFMEMMQQIFHNHFKYRYLLLCFVHIMEQNKIIAKRYCLI